MAALSAAEIPVVTPSAASIDTVKLVASAADCGYPLQAAMKRIAREGRGVVVVLRKPTTSRGLANQLHTYQLEDDGLDGSVGDQVWDVRSYGLGAQILSAIGIHTMRVLSSPKNVHGLSGFNLEIVEYVECD
ncbi:MAG TPA: hypothetical protein EYN15_03505 [Chromatiales bacterium]|nr:hypothetical protein [Chromatiales bacterium]